ncbi:MAG TPA: hypothetical protein VNZ50_09075 [Hyphomicrobiaceae bacterium]|nr:hypothetical protein [Hyphomicrobiaceae bacterium]
MHTLKNPRRLAMIAAVLAGSIIGTFAVASPIVLTAESASSARHCANTLCPNLLWLRAPVLRPHSR